MQIFGITSGSYSFEEIGEKNYFPQNSVILLHISIHIMFIILFNFEHNLSRNNHASDLNCLQLHRGHNQPKRFIDPKKRRH